MLVCKCTERSYLILSDLFNPNTLTLATNNDRTLVSTLLTLVSTLLTLVQYAANPRLSTLLTLVQYAANPRQYAANPRRVRC